MAVTEAISWPSSWLTVLVAAALAREADYYLPTKEVIRRLSGFASDASVWRILHRMDDAGIVSRLSEGNTKTVKLTHEGRRHFERFAAALDSVGGY